MIYAAPTPAALYGIAAEIAKRVRRLHEFDVGPAFKLATNKIKIRVATKAEQDIALVGAHRYAETKAKDAPSAAQDQDLLGDAKSAFVVFASCRDFETPEKMPAFMAPEWMMDNLTADEIAYLLNLVNEVRTAESPAPKDLSDAVVEDLIGLCAENAGNDIPEAVLAHMSREYLTSLAVLISMKLVDARHALDVLTCPPSEIQ